MPLSPEWAKLPKRHCDDCGKMYKQVRPRREGEMGFCSDNCRKSYHKHGGAYRKLKVEMKRMVEKRFAELQSFMFNAIHAEVLQELDNHTDTRRQFAEAFNQSLNPSNPAAQRANR